MITPKATFIETAKTNGWRWQDTVDSTQFQTAATAAMMQMTINNSNPPDMATASALAWRLEGAKQFLAILMGLMQTSPEPKRLTGTDNLNHRP